MIQRDKQLHLFAGALIAITVGALTAAWIGFLVATAAGALKECYDYFHPAAATCDGMDFVYTVGGGLLACLILIALK